MITNLFLRICFLILLIFIYFIPISATFALPSDWILVPKSNYGVQLWDKNSIQHNQDGSIRVLSKFIPKSTSKISSDILYTMDVNCSKKTFNSSEIFGASSCCFFI